MSAHWYEHSERLLVGGTNEYLAGVEWDINDRLTVSGGGQLTRYQLTDQYMNDMSFVVNSYSFGLGLEYKVTDRVKLPPPTSRPTMRTTTWTRPHRAWRPSD